MSSNDETFGSGDDGDKGGDNVGSDRVKSAIDQETEQGFRGSAVDQTPNRAYTVAGVNAGDETPETKAGKSDK